mmetsp:Transcript_15463/g.42546  ORF Transcript_15463/g.42546 Transcript_15463/m.42546 type:complete len:420 (+) Transcript_15463:125-1384(+)
MRGQSGEDANAGAGFDFFEQHLKHIRVGNPSASASAARGESGRVGHGALSSMSTCQPAKEASRGAPVLKGFAGLHGLEGPSGRPPSTESGARGAPLRVSPSQASTRSSDGRPAEAACPSQVSSEGRCSSPPPGAGHGEHRGAGYGCGGLFHGPDPARPCSLGSGGESSLTPRANGRSRALTVGRGANSCNSVYPPPPRVSGGFREPSRSRDASRGHGLSHDPRCNNGDRINPPRCPHGRSLSPTREVPPPPPPPPRLPSWSRAVAMPAAPTVPTQADEGKVVEWTLDRTIVVEPAETTSSGTSFGCLGPMRVITPSSSASASSTRQPEETQCCCCGQARSSFFDHRCPKCNASVCMSCLEDFRLIMESYRCPRCGDEGANQELLRQEKWMRDAYRNTSRTFNAIGESIASLFGGRRTMN